MGTREAIKAMITKVDGGWTVAAAYLGMSVSALENRVYEKKGQSLSTQDALVIQDFSKTTLFAEAIATASGGTFVKLPDIDGAGNDELLFKFNELQAEMGRLAQEYSSSVKDGVVTDTESASLESIGREMHRTIQELLALTFKIYKRN